MNYSRYRSAFLLVILTVVLAQLSPAQTAQAILTIDVENFVQYFDDTFDVAKRATSPSVTPALAGRNFASFVALADVFAINGQPAKGNFALQARTVNFATQATPGQAVGDITRGAMVDARWELLKNDGTPIGSIIAAGLSGGAPPPGAPLVVTTNNTVITGGTGAFLGVRGQAGQSPPPQPVPMRLASMAEDPAARRALGGGRLRFTLHLIAMTEPRISATTGGPAVFHADFAPVTGAKPAAPGETLIAMVAGLGPTRPGVDPGQPFLSFPQNPAHVATSPVEVLVNGGSAEVFNSIGWPGLVDTYRVDFRVPEATPTGPATIQLKAAWIAGPTIQLPVR